MAAQQLDCSSKFDIVFSNAALHWINDHRPVLAGIRKCLRAGGWMLVPMGGKGNAADVLGVFEVMRHEPAWRQYFAGFSLTFGFFSAEEYRLWLWEAGLSPVRVELIRKDMSYPSREGFAG